MKEVPPLYIILDGAETHALHLLRQTQGYPKLRLEAIPGFLAEQTGTLTHRERSLFVSADAAKLSQFHLAMSAVWTVLPIPLEAVEPNGLNDSTSGRFQMHATVGYLIGGRLNESNTDDNSQIVVVCCAPQYIPCLVHANKYVNISVAWWEEHLPPSMGTLLRKAGISFINLSRESEVDLTEMINITDEFLG